MFKVSEIKCSKQQISQGGTGSCQINVSGDQLIEVL